jgi:hypothetical protein
VTRRILSIAALFGVLAMACGKYGPPVRLRAEAANVERSETTGATGATSAADETGAPADEAGETGAPADEAGEAGAPADEAGETGAPADEALEPEGKQP